MVKNTTRTQRKLTKKLSRVQDGFDEADGSTSHGIQASAVLADGTLPAAHLRTKRERMIAKNLSLASHSPHSFGEEADGGFDGANDAADEPHSTHAPQGTPKTALKKRLQMRKKVAKKASSAAAKDTAASRHDTRDHDSDGEEEEHHAHAHGDGDVVRAARQQLRARAASGAASSGHGGAGTSAKAQTRQGTAALREMASGKKKRTRPEKGGASVRMTQVHEELNLFDKVLNVPAFSADPLGMIEDHLASTMDMLQPLTPDVGRVPRP